jgi:AI-2 transport protein TqsA
MKQPSMIKPLLILAGAVIVLAGMYFATSLITPILLALFFATLLSPIHRWLKRRLPGGLALLLTMGVLVLVAIFLILLIGTSLTTMVASLDSYSEQFSQRQAELAAQSEELSQTSIFKQFLSALDPAALVNMLGFILSAAASLLKSGVLILIVTMFVLAESSQFKKRMVGAFGPDHFFPRNMTSLVQMMINYFGLRAVVNLVTATATGVMLWLFGIPNAGLWTVLIFFLSFIPYIGAFFAMIPPLLLAYAQGGLGLVIVIGLLSVVINAITENLVAPLVMGKGLSISPTVVFLSFIFWMFILGGPGAFIAMPLTVALILFMRSFEETRGLAEMLVTIREPAVETTVQPGTATT